MSNLPNILQKLEQSRILTQFSDKLELSHDILANQIAAKRTAEDKFLIEWELLIRNKLKDCKKTGVKDYLTPPQLSVINEILSKLRLDQAEMNYLLDSKEFHQKERAGKQRQFYIYVASIFTIILFIGYLMLWALGEKVRVDSETARKKRIIGNLYFYAGRFALVVKKDKGGQIRYGFMDKEGKTTIPFDYSEAGPFDEFGYARVKILDKLYLIDTFNNRYPLAETVLAINDSTLAISLREQDLKELPSEILKTDKLKVLYLRGNQLKKLPENIVNLTNLRSLDLAFNELEKIPENFVNLYNLVQLNLQNNEIASLDIDKIQFSKNLNYLNLSKNSLDLIPDWITQLKRLAILDLSNNNLSIIPESIADMSELKKLNLFGNPVQSIPEKLKKSKIDVYLKNNYEKKSVERGGDNRKENLTDNKKDENTRNEQKLNAEKDSAEIQTRNKNNSVTTTATANSKDTKDSSNTNQKKSLNIDCNMLNEKKGVKEIFESKSLVIHSQIDFEYNLIFSRNNYDIKLKLSTSDAYILNQDKYKIMFISEKDEKKIYSFAW